MELKSDITSLSNDVALVRGKLKSDFTELDNKIDISTMKIKSTLRLHNWMFGTVITISLGILLTIIFK